ncbi:MAG: type II toxin-antitoxin system RatA family toxin [Rhodoferax sp.]|uniref:type II toxin-antitoxin system RatA family toxin n=1 Tax=Rhodoferax sp. TaxID=50421 RepID=UPI003015C44F
MKNVHKSVLLSYSPEEMYRLVTEVDLYPKFLPWCASAREVTVDESSTVVEMGIAFHGVGHIFTTRNHHIPGRQVTMTLVDGPFSRLDGEWNFIPLGDGSQRACKVELSLTYGFNHVTLEKFVGSAFDHIALSMVDAFVRRAVQVYGE